MRPRRGNKITEDGVTFDSAGELGRYRELRMLQRSGEISKLTCHTLFKLLVQGVQVSTYTCDFTYHDREDRLHVEDVKGFRISEKTGKQLAMTNREFGLKLKLMRALFGIDVEVVLRNGL